MNSKEFDNYLESIGGLVNAYKVDSIIKDRIYFDFSDGWLDITKDLIEDLIKLGWNKHIFQAKEKFGGGRFYIGSSSTEMDERIMKWEEQTYKTCEECGSTIEVETSASGHGWIRTVCSSCRKT